MLDLWQGDKTGAFEPGEESPDLPATFGETFDAAWQEGRLFGQSTSGETARLEALQDHIDDLSARTGKDVNQSIDFSGFNVPGVGFVPPPAQALLPQVNEAAKKLGQPELSADQLEENAVAKSREAEGAYAAMGERERTTGGGFGLFLGGAAAQATDPINLVAATAAPEAESTSLLAAALRWGVIGGVSQAGIEAAGAPYREEVQPGYEQEAALPNILMATGEGVLLGGTTRALGNLWTRLKTGAWSTSVRDAGNLAESEANIAASNVLPGVAGEVAHRQALSEAIDNILGGMPVDASAVTQIERERPAAAAPGPIDASHDVVSGANSTRDGTILIDRHIPQFSPVLKDASGQPADLWKYLSIHERTEADAMARGMPYAQAHEEIATPAERAAVEADGVNWAEYTKEIDGYLDHIEHEQVSNPPPPDTHVNPEAAIGHHRAANKQTVMEARTGAVQATEEARTAAAPSGEAQPRLPFEATAAQGRAETANGLLADGVAQIARRAGYAMPPDEAAAVAARLVALTPERAQGALHDLQVNPRTVAEWAKGPAEAQGRPPVSPAAEGAQVPVAPVDESRLASPEFTAALRADVDRERATGDVQIPVDVDKDGNPVMRGVDAAMNEVDAFQRAAEQIQACAAPAPEEAEAA